MSEPKYAEYTDAECVEAVVALDEFIGKDACAMLCGMAIGCGSTQEAMAYVPPLDKFNTDQQDCVKEVLSKAIEGYRRANKCIPGHSLN